jgi:uncharacterized integral membrane protein
MLSKFRVYIGWGLVALLVIFIYLNQDSVKIRFFVGTLYMPVAFVIIFSASLGAGAVLAFRYIRKLKGPPK